MAGVKRNKNGVKNSLVNNINARKKKGKSRPKKKSTISKKAYSAMQNKWGKPTARNGKKAGRNKSGKNTARRG